RICHLTRVRGDSLGIVRDEVFFHPGRARSLHPQVEQPLFRFLNKLPGLLGRRGRTSPLRMHPLRSPPTQQNNARGDRQVSHPPHFHSSSLHNPGSPRPSASSAAFSLSSMRRSFTTVLG